MQLLNWRLQLRSTMSAWCGSFLILASGLFAWRIGESVSRIDLVLFWCVGGLALTAHRLGWLLVLPGAIRTGGLRRRQVALLCFHGVEPGAVSRTLYRYGNAVSMLTTVRRLPETGDFETQVDGLIASVRGQDIDEIYVAADLADAVSLREIGGRLRVLPQSVTLLPVGSLCELLARDRVDLGSTIAVELQRAALSQFERARKRVFDIACALAGLMLLSPLLAATAVAIHFDSSGPILFRQTRHGFNGRPFKIYKFRTMRVLEDGAVIRQATANDPRVTRVGKFLRRFSIDELPQLLNVLSGEMSLVGPRPHASAHDKHFSEILEKYTFRNHVKAGLTGWAQVNGARGETDTLEKMQRRVELDIWYINHWSLWLDLRIVMRTLRIVLTGENAH
jgi:putative colanic acid biosynthesis UDP-glucose lipid carrier transferase